MKRARERWDKERAPRGERHPSIVGWDMPEKAERKPFEAACRDCSAPIVWARSTRKDGTPCNMAFDPAPAEGGRYALAHPAGDRTKLVARYMKPGEVWPEGSLPRTPHYLTCSSRSARPPGGAAGSGS